MNLMLEALENPLTMLSLEKNLNTDLGKEGRGREGEADLSKKRTLSPTLSPFPALIIIETA